MRVLSLCLILCLVGCSTTTTGAADSEALRRAAVSWVGAPLDDMISAWGEPGEHLIIAAPGRNGLVRWRDTLSADTVEPMFDSYRCAVEARYASDRTVLRVDTITHDCESQTTGRYQELVRRPN